MRGYNRRRFLQASSAASLWIVAGTRASGKILGANDRIRVAVAGINGRGQHHIREFASMKGVEVACLVDPDTRLYESRSKQVVQRGGKEPQCVADIRRVLEDKNIDVVSVATCNHWHSLITVWACQAGKDVYVEKPISHNVFEGRQCVAAAKKYGRIVQHGTQQRSSLSRAREIAAVRSGRYGKLVVSKGYCCKPRWSIGRRPFSNPPEGFEYDIWLGPAPKQRFHANLHPYNWHWFWDFGNGDIGNQGVHEMDVARWAIEGATLPERVWSVGGRFTPDGPDNGETPNMLLTVMQFGDVTLLFETRGLVGKRKPRTPPRKVANEFYTTEGVIRDGKFYPKGGGDPVRVEGDASVTPGGPFGSFIDCVRRRDPGSVNGDAETAHYSAALCHLGNISYRLGTTAPVRQRPALLGDHPRVLESFAMLQENLEMAYQMAGEKAADIASKLTFTVGKPLVFDAKSERFVDDDAANRLLTRPYRPPYVVPERV
ncbi:MAG TPA: Gfo/Idh/MocA family oxidoreductase [Planctomycetaceae bacterium]|nr:Gfo/Idh/MocA family oxidoreductase [Planctomycetaceae bacterium]